MKDISSVQLFLIIVIIAGACYLYNNIFDKDYIEKQDYKEIIYKHDTIVNNIERVITIHKDSIVYIHFKKDSVKTVYDGKIKKVDYESNEDSIIANFKFVLQKYKCE